MSFLFFFFKQKTAYEISACLVGSEMCIRDRVIAAELFNTAIEKLVDLVSPQQHPVAGQVKDIAAGAVLVCAATAAIIGLIVFIPYLTRFFL